MELQLSLAGNGPILFNPGLPDNYSGRILTDAHHVHATGINGDLILQEYQGKQFNVRYGLARFIQRLGIQGFTHRPGLYIRIMLEGSQQFRIKDLGKVRLHKGQYLIVHTEEAECLGHYERRINYQWLDLFFSPALVLPVANHYPGLSSLLKRDHAPLLRLSRPNSKMNIFIWQLVKDLFKSPEVPADASLYFDDRVNELLVALLENGYYSPAHYNFSQAQEQSFIELKEFIEANYTEHFTIDQLAQRIGINAFDLKAGFKQLFGKGVFEVLLACRMKKALDLVLHSDQQMKQIAFEIGYKRLSSFIIAFRKYYGHPPGLLRYQQ